MKKNSNGDKHHKSVLFLLLILLCSIQYLSAQKLDTIYLNNFFLPATVKDYTYYRVVQKHPKQDSVFVQTDYFKTGEIKQLFYYYSIYNKEVNNKNYEELISKNKLLKHGNWVSFGQPGQIRNVRQYDKGRTLFGYGIHPERGDTIYDYVDKMPEFPGGENGLRAHIRNEIRYPFDAASQKISGKVYVSFTIEKNGEVTDIRIARGIHPSLDKEAIRVISTLPRWEPGIQNGVPKNVLYTIPINFMMQ